MAIVGVDSGSLYRRTYSLCRLACTWVGGHLAPSLNEPGELSQWLCHDDSTINIVLELLLLLLLLLLFNPATALLTCVVCVVLCRGTCFRKRTVSINEICI